MQNKVDSALMALTGPDWRTALKESAVNANLRYAEETRRNLAKCEFQELIERGECQVRHLTVVYNLAEAKRAYDKDHSTDNLAELAEAISELQKILKDKTTSGVDCELAVLQAAWEGRGPRHRTTETFIELNTYLMGGGLSTRYLMFPTTRWAHIIVDRFPPKARRRL